jgi:UDP-sulfoquinovose synthase
VVLRAHIRPARVTDLMQEPVYGLSTDEVDRDERLLPSFHYDDIFGTVANRFLVQAVAGVPLPVDGTDGRVRGYLNLKDTLQCVELAMTNPVERGQLRILNQFTEPFSVNQLAEKVQKVGTCMGLEVQIVHLDNPRKEREEPYYHPKHHGLLEPPACSRTT